MVENFLDDSRYPSEDPGYRERNRQMVVAIHTAGASVVVETTLPGSEMESRQLSVVERTEDKLIAESRQNQALSSLVLLMSDEPQGITGTLDFRTYEVTHIWSLRCELRNAH
jgi:hypothetical protein